MAFQATVSQYAAALAEMGYVTYTFDFCGGCAINGKSDGLTTEMSVSTEAKDLESVLDYAASRSYANPNHIVVMGRAALFPLWSRQKNDTRSKN